MISRSNGYTGPSATPSGQMQTPQDMLMLRGRHRHIRLGSSHLLLHITDCTLISKWHTDVSHSTHSKQRDLYLPQVNLIKANDTASSGPKIKSYSVTQSWLQNKAGTKGLIIRTRTAVCVCVSQAGISTCRWCVDRKRPALKAHFCLIWPWQATSYHLNAAVFRQQLIRMNSGSCR